MENPTVPDQPTDAPDTGTAAEGTQPPADTPPATPPSPADMPATKPTEPPAGSDTGTDTGEADGTDTGEADDKGDAKLRRENAKWRTDFRKEQAARAALEKSLEELRAKTTESDERWAQFAAVFNPQGATEEPPDPAKLAEQITALQAENAAKDKAHADQAQAHADQVRALTISAALPAAYSAAQADPALTQAVLTTTGALAKLDPTSDSFSTDLASAVEAAVKANPRLKVTPVVTRSGAEIPGGNGGSTQVTREQLDRMSSEEIVKAQKEGRLKNLLGG